MAAALFDIFLCLLAVLGIVIVGGLIIGVIYSIIKALRGKQPQKLTVSRGEIYGAAYTLK